jgi:MFS family permease
MEVFMHDGTITNGAAGGSRIEEFRAGWPIVLAAAMGIGVGLTGLPFFTFGVFLKPLATTFHWTRSQVSLGTLCLHGGTVLTSPFLGRFVDRYGARRIALLSLAGLGLGFGGVALSGPSLTSFYVAWTALALLGCATTPLPWTRLLSLHFDRGRGLALGLALAGTGLASLIGPRFAGWLIADVGWRAAYVVLGGFVLLVALPIAAAASRRAPDMTRGEAARKTGLSLREASATRWFWLMAVAFFLIVTCESATIVHLVPLLTDRGLPPPRAAALAGLLGLALVVGRLIAGQLSDRYHAPYVAAFFLALPALGLIGLATSHAMPVTVTAVILIGLAGGAEVDMLSYLTGRYFGMAHYGEIYGVNLAIFALAAGTGPVLAGWSFDRAGGYEPALWAGAAIFLIGSALLTRMGPYPNTEPR